ncbi:Protein of unknown function [Bacillus cytotoxicus]|nr:Protein of unknown function [Bacillus cytotoxicus]
MVAARFYLLSISYVLITQQDKEKKFAQNRL